MRDLERVQKLVGRISAEQMRFVEYAVHDHLGVFMPMAGQCEYATSPRHSHPAYSFVLAFDATCRTLFEDEVVVSVPSTLSMMPPQLPHQELPSETVSRYIVVMVDAAFFESRQKLYNTPVTAGPKDLFPFSERLVQACKEFIIDYQEALPGFAQLLTSAEQKICHLIIRQLLGINQKEHPIAGSIAIHRAVEYVHGHYGDSISVDLLASRAGVSPSHFSRLFKKEMGMAPAEYLLQFRLDFAKRMLRNGDKTLTEIALDCGFNSSSYFSQRFSMAFGISPSKYRHLHLPDRS